MKRNWTIFWIISWAPGLYVMALLQILHLINSNYGHYVSVLLKHSSETDIAINMTFHCHMILFMKGKYVYLFWITHPTRQLGALSKREIFKIIWKRKYHFKKCRIDYNFFYELFPQYISDFIGLVLYIFLWNLIYHYILSLFTEIESKMYYSMLHYFSSVVYIPK